MGPDGMRMCELLGGLPDVAVLGVADLVLTAPIVVHIETRRDTPVHCAACSTPARVKDRDQVRLIDLPVFGWGPG